MKLSSKLRRAVCFTGSTVLLAGVMCGFAWNHTDAFAVRSEAASYGASMGTSYTVSANLLNVRIGPGINYARCGQLTQGYPVTVEETRSGWGYIGDGWVDLDYLRPTKNSYRPDTGYSGVVNASSLNIRRGPGLEYSAIGSYTNGYRVNILETDGGWGRTSDGWVKLSYISGYVPGSSSGSSSSSGSQNSSTGSGVVVNSDVVVTSSYLNVRQGPGTNYQKVGRLTNGERVTILELQNGWGRTKDGWISLSYVRAASSSDHSGIITAGSNVIVDADSLNVRSGPGANYQKVGALTDGYRVRIEEVSGGWGRISDGWISLKYVNLVK